MGAPARRLVSSQNAGGRRRAQVLSLVQARGFVVVELLVRELGITRAAARYDLALLVRFDLVHVIGSTRDRVWFSAGEWRRLQQERAA